MSIYVPQRNAAVAMRVDTITQIDMSYMALEDAHVLPLCEALPLNTSVAKIDLSNNAIGDAGAVALANACERNTTVTEVDMRYNDCNYSRDGKAAMQRVEAACAVRVPLRQISSYLLTLAVKKFKCCVRSQLKFFFLINTHSHLSHHSLAP